MGELGEVIKLTRWNGKGYDRFIIAESCTCCGIKAEDCHEPNASGGKRNLDGELSGFLACGPCTRLTNMEYHLCTPCASKKPHEEHLKLAPKPKASDPIPWWETPWEESPPE